MAAIELGNDRDSSEGLRELARADFGHLDDGHWTTPITIALDEQLRAAARGGSLPYDLLDAYAFERLCFHILLTRGQGAPRFWGRRGQAQQGIDLILSDGATSVVYQCKHTATFDDRALKTAVHKFRDDWLTRPELGRPATFVLCTSAKLDATTAWEERKRGLSNEIGVAIEEWHRDLLDAWLKTKPGIVSELFGDQVAQLFCGGECGQRDGLFQPLKRGVEKRIDRYLDLVAEGRFVRDDRDETLFEQILSQHQVVLLGGLAGAGKTMTAIDLAAAFENGAWRVFYLRADASRDVDRIVDAILSHGFRPSIFVIDDCQRAFEEIERIVWRLSGLDHPVKLVLTARAPPASMDFIESTGTALIWDLRERGQVIDIVADETRYRALVAKRMPEWSSPPIKQIMAWTGRDLTILDLVLDTMEPADFKNIKRLDDLFPKIRKLVFEKETAHAPNLKQLAAMAQFDIAVPEELFPTPFESGRSNSTAVARFVVAGGEPSSLAFHHPSAAELVFRILAWAHGEPDPAQACARDCAEVLNTVTGMERESGIRESGIR